MVNIQLLDTLILKQDWPTALTDVINMASCQEGVPCPPRDTTWDMRNPEQAKNNKTYNTLVEGETIYVLSQL